MTAVDDVWDWDAWVSRIPEHAMSLRDLLMYGTPEAREEAEARRRKAESVDRTTGHLGDGPLCWVCYSSRTFVGRFTPRFRACRPCLRHDREMASALGLKMLLPLMDWHTQPVLPGRSFPTEPALVNGLGEMWSSLSVLNRWRIDGVRLALAWLDVDESTSVEISDWEDALTWGAKRSALCWDAYVRGYFSEVFEAVLAASTQPGDVN